jgi:hypothetical protein
VARHGDDVVFKVFETLIMALPSLDKERKEHFLLQKPFVMLITGYFETKNAKVLC